MDYVKDGTLTIQARTIKEVNSIIFSFDFFNIFLRSKIKKLDYERDF